MEQFKEKFEPLDFWLCVFSVHFQREARVAFEFTFVTRWDWVEVGARRERIRGLCWQLVELLEDKFLARLPALPKLMPNILRRGKHKKLSSLNRRRGPEKIIVIPRKKSYVFLNFVNISICLMGDASPNIWATLGLFYIYREIFLPQCISNDFSLNPNRNISPEKDKRNTLNQPWEMLCFTIPMNLLAPTDGLQNLVHFL